MTRPTRKARRKASPIDAFKVRLIDEVGAWVNNPRQGIGPDVGIWIVTNVWKAMLRADLPRVGSRKGKSK